MIETCGVCGGIYRYEIGGYGGICNMCEELPEEEEPEEEEEEDTGYYTPEEPRDNGYYPGIEDRC